MTRVAIVVIVKDGPRVYPPRTSPSPRPLGLLAMKRYITLHCITSHYSTLQYIALRYSRQTRSSHCVVGSAPERSAPRLQCPPSRQCPPRHHVLAVATRRISIGCVVSHQRAAAAAAERPSRAASAPSVPTGVPCRERWQALCVARGWFDDGRCAFEARSVEKGTVERRSRAASPRSAVERAWRIMMSDEMMR